jgi:hypothetical protein
LEAEIMTTLTVGYGKEFSTITAAVDAAHNNDVIDVQAGTYVNNFAVISKSLTLQAVGGMVHLTETHRPPNAKGMLTIGTVGDAPNVTIKGFEISGVAIPASLGDNGAAVRWQSGNLTLEHDWFHNNQEGLLGTPLTKGAGNLTIRYSEFGFNGSGNGQTHGLYVGLVHSLTINHSYFHDTVAGHEIKSRAENNTITDDRIFGGSSTDSYQIDLPNGGDDIVTGNILEKGLHSENPRFIAFGEAPALTGRPLWEDSSLLAENNVFVSDRGRGVAAIWNASGLDLVTAAHDRFWNIPRGSAFLGWVHAIGNVELAFRPTLDFRHPWL